LLVLHQFQKAIFLAIQCDFRQQYWYNKVLAEGKIMKITFEVNSIDELKELKSFLGVMEIPELEEKPEAHILFSKGILEILEHNGIYSLEDLCQYSEVYLLKMPFIGAEEILQIKDILSFAGLSLRK
jgi:DNA-directed RNA polymerase alpha subunit